MTIKFTKMHGLGNDFVVIDAISQQIALSLQQIREIADRHMGVGCDQLLLVERPQSNQAEFRYRIFNADGGEVEQCGNGARCFALFVRQQGLTTNELISVETAGGLIELKVEGEQVRVDMGVPNFSPESLPFITEKQAESYKLMVNGAEYAIGAVSMGNPHAVICVDKLEQMEIEEIGLAVQQLPDFPQQVNVGFVEQIDNREIRLRVFERGAGETLACGTGACAAVAVLRMLGKVEESVKVKLRGGDLIIQWPGEGQNLFMTGPATTVFEGQINCD